MFYKDSIVSLQPLIITKDKKHYIVENQSSREFFEMPEICVDALKLIESKRSLGSIEEALKADYPNEEVDIMSFVRQLHEMELLKSVDDQEIKTKNEDSSKNGFEWIPVKIGKAFFNKVTVSFYILVFFIISTLLFTDNGLLPVYNDLFVFEAMMLNLFLFMLISFFLLLIHEAGHILALRSFGFSTKVEIGHRLFFIVLEADMTPAWKLGTSRRNLVYLAGICFDLVVLFISFILESWFIDSGNKVLLGILGMINLNIFLRILYQCCFYMKTDLYYVIENTSGNYNLMEEAKEYLSGKISFISGKKVQSFSQTEHFVKWYSYFYLGGTFLTLGLALVYLVPQTIYALSTSIKFLNYPVSSLLFWDGLVILSQVIILISLLFYSWSKKKRDRNSRRKLIS